MPFVAAHNVPLALQNRMTFRATFFSLSWTGNGVGKPFVTERVTISIYMWAIKNNETFTLFGVEYKIILTSIHFWIPFSLIAKERKIEVEIMYTLCSLWIWNLDMDRLYAGSNVESLVAKCHTPLSFLSSFSQKTVRDADKSDTHQ